MKIKTGIYQRLDESYFFDRFKECGRESQFSYEGCGALFQYLDSLSDDLGEPIEFDCIALCCEYAEYKDIAEFNKDYDTKHESMDDIDETSVIPIDDESFIIQQF